MLITSRSADEYRAMFDLAGLSTDSVLDCCAGGAGFTADVGGAATALDPVYALGPAKLPELVRQGAQRTGALAEANARWTRAAPLVMLRVSATAMKSCRSTRSKRMAIPSPLSFRHGRRLSP